MPFDDDDEKLFAAGSKQPAENETAGGDEAMEDEMPDYKLFMSMFNKKGVSSKTIRKGEKDFESHGTKAQDGALEASRQAMEEVLSYTRIHREDAWVRGWYFPGWWAQYWGETTGAEGIYLQDRVVVMEHERGHWMKDIGRTVSGNKENRGVGKLWLLPEEALYLVERGTIDLWWPDKPFEELLPKNSASGSAVQSGLGPDDYEAGVPLSLEAAYCMLIGDNEKEQGKISLPRYQVYAHLKRAGFIILRAPTEPSPPEPAQTPTRTLWQWMQSLISPPKRPAPNPYGPLVQPGLYRAYRPIYEQLALLPRHSPRKSKPSGNMPTEPFRVFFHVWKAGGAPFSKKNPPPPDFRIAVADTSDSCVPTLGQIEALLESTPHDPPRSEWQGNGRTYQRLKHGQRNVLVAVVDRGLVNFMRFGEGAFGEEEIFDRFDTRGGGRGRGGKRGGRGGGRGRGGRGGRGKGRGR